MKHFRLLTVVAFLALLAACIRDEAPNDEADIISISFPEGYLRARQVEIGNDYIVLYPKKDVNAQELPYTDITLSAGASCQRTASGDSETLYYLDVTSESGNYVKRYAVRASYFPASFDFETWTTPTAGFAYENPKEGSLQWFSSNNGAALAWNSATKPAADYPIRRSGIAASGATAAELRTMEGPGNVMGLMNIPVMSGSLYLGGFDALTGLTNPLHSTRFGVPFSDGKPVKLTGYYIYKPGAGAYINPDGTASDHKNDMCAIYAVLFKTDDRTQFLYGENIATSPNVVARAELHPDEVVQSEGFTRFEIAFDYDTYSVPFSFAELYNDEYKITIVFASSRNGDNYEGRIGNTLIIDNVELIYEEEN